MCCLKAGAKGKCSKKPSLSEAASRQEQRGRGVVTSELVQSTADKSLVFCFKLVQ